MIEHVTIKKLYTKQIIIRHLICSEIITKFVKLTILSENLPEILLYQSKTDTFRNMLESFKAIFFICFHAFSRIVSTFSQSEELLFCEHSSFSL